MDMVYDDGTWGQSQVMTRWEAEFQFDRRLSRGLYVGGKRVKEATIVYLDPQPTRVFAAEGLA